MRNRREDDTGIFTSSDRDIFGVEEIEADTEIISLSYQIMKNFGLTEKQFEIRISFGSNASKKDVEKLIEKLKGIGIKNAVFDETIARGMQYYTGIVFEIYDTGKENARALFARSGRYRQYSLIFLVLEKVSAVGIGAGDVGIRNLLETYNLLPNIAFITKLYICVMSEKQIEYAQNLAQKIRNACINVAVDYTLKKIGEQIQYADKNKIPYVSLVIGENEVKTGKLKIKNLSTGKETEITEDAIANIIK